MSKVAATQAKMGGVGGVRLGAGMGGQSGGGKASDPLAALMAGLGGGKSAGGKNLARDSNSLLNMLKRLEQAQKHATDVSVEGLRKESDAANKTADALNKRNRARGAGGGSGGAGGGGGGGGVGGGDAGDGGGGGRFGKYRNSFSQGFMQKISGIDFMQGGMQGVAQMLGGALGGIASQVAGSVTNALGGIMKSPLSVLSQGSGAITTLAQSMPFSGLFGGGVQQNVDFAQQELSNQRSLSGLLPYVSRNEGGKEAGQRLVDERRGIASDAYTIGGMNPNEGFSAMASAAAGAGGLLSGIRSGDRKNMLALNKLGISDLGNSASILRDRELGYTTYTGKDVQKYDSGILGQAASDANDFGLEGSEAQGYLRSIAEGIHSVVHTGIKFDQAGRADTIRAMMAGGGFMSGQRAQNLGEGFRDHVNRVSLQGPQSAEDFLLMKQYGFNPEKGGSETARVLKEMSKEKNLPRALTGYISAARSISSHGKDGNVNDFQMVRMLQGAGINSSLQEAEGFRRDGDSKDVIRRNLKNRRRGAGYSDEELQSRASAQTPELVRPTIRRESIGFETGVNLAPDVQALDARQGEFTRQLTSTARAFGDFSMYLSDFTTRLTGIGAPVAQSRPMTQAQ